MRIAISGKSGCGNTTVTTLVSKALGYPMINFTFRNLSKERGIEFWDFCRLAEQSDEPDREVDSRQVRMALSQKDCVLGSRLAIWMLKEADLKVYLTATTEERARRVQKREGGTFEQRLRETTQRDAHDSARYERLYGIDNNDTSVADLVIDTTDKSAEDVAKIIIEKATSMSA
ncbi:MAG: AAA family ATPase [Sphaerochaeta sp.]|jgi:cytidylate kinase|nr:AAA family ATPase [Sphaerochaeta sp.]MCH3919829.1 AAA family ATPase [Sphaerochaeta sp.]MCI2076915.1 AAA family ATPase [Sphaerochaeta sp.]MCI2096928.1 AAA family ATPase [Sphaerochaeta sp.]MCI2103944.1 AAA family ATPase [Sphaerochaeta sp.]